MWSLSLLVAVTVVAHLRAKCTFAEIDGPLPLNCVVTEPWIGGARALAPTLTQHVSAYSIFTSLYPQLFDLEQLRIGRVRIFV